MALLKHRSDVSAELEEELSHVPLQVTGEIPEWLSGALVRNGPVYVTVRGESNSHWFDGLAMLHLFSFNQGEVSYTNRFLRTTAFDDVFEHGRLYAGFAADPCRSLFSRLFTKLFPTYGRELPNANVNVFKLADDYIAMTEVPLPVRFDIETLETLGVLDYADELPKEKCWESAHPHYDPQRKETINYLIEYGRKSHYLLYRIADGEIAREVIARIPVDEPAYMHSFAVTENYIVLAEFPFVVKPLDLITKGKPFIKNFAWKPERGTQFIVVERRTGEVIGRYESDPFFAFHHANAFEEAGAIVLDIVCYDDASIICEIGDHFRNGGEEDRVVTRLDRFFLSLDEGVLSCKRLLEGKIEFPRIHDLFEGRPYRYLYLVDAEGPGSEEEIRPLYKFDTAHGTTKTWAEVGCYPGEPIFVARPQKVLAVPSGCGGHLDHSAPHPGASTLGSSRSSRPGSPRRGSHLPGLSEDVLFVPSPDGREEDEGVVVSIVIDRIHHTSFLLVLDASSFEERARAQVSHLIPAGLHGRYFPAH